MFSTLSTAESIILKAELGQMEQWQSEGQDEQGSFNFSLRLLEMKEIDGKWLPSAHVGVADESGENQFQIVLAKTSKGIILGYKYTEGGSIIFHKSVLSGVPLGEIIKVKLNVNTAGVVSVNTVGLHKDFQTNIVKPYGVFGVSGAKVEFFPES